MRKSLKNISTRHCDPLVKQLKTASIDPNVIQVIRSAKVVERIEEEYQTGRLDKEVLSEVMKRYKGLELEQLLIIWLENYNSLMIMTPQSKENECSYLTRHKLIAIGKVIDENY